MMKWIAFSVSSFIFILSLVFGAMLYLKPPPKKPLKQKNRVTSSKTHFKKIGHILNARDSLVQVIDDYEKEIDRQKKELDSLKQVLAEKNDQLGTSQKEIEKLTVELKNKGDQDVRAKSMAKTLSSLTLKKMAPILNKLDDETIILIYNQTSRSARKNILMALSEDRAAKITRKLVN